MHCSEVNSSFGEGQVEDTVSPGRDADLQGRAGQAGGYTFPVCQSLGFMELDDLLFIQQPLTDFESVCVVCCVGTSMGFSILMAQVHR